jgi:hypothetical protein
MFRRFAIASVLLSSCGGAPVATPSANVPHASSAGAAAVTTGAAAAFYVVGGGCKIAGCQSGLVCNRATERCDPAPCGAAGCPVGSTCDRDRDRCVAVSR